MIYIKISSQLLLGASWSVLSRFLERLLEFDSLIEFFSYYLFLSYFLAFFFSFMIKIWHFEMLLSEMPTILPLFHLDRCLVSNSNCWPTLGPLCRDSSHQERWDRRWRVRLHLGAGLVLACLEHFHLAGVAREYQRASGS